MEGRIHMDEVVSGMLFEWLLASWAGFNENPEQIFPHLNNVNSEKMNEELVNLIKKSQLVRQAV
jgi:hypothetical protein